MQLLYKNNKNTAERWMDFILGDFPQLLLCQPWGVQLCTVQFTAGCVENKGQQELFRLILRGPIPTVPDWSPLFHAVALFLPVKNWSQATSWVLTLNQSHCLLEKSRRPLPFVTKSDCVQRTEIKSVFSFRKVQQKWKNCHFNPLRSIVLLLPIEWYMPKNVKNHISLYFNIKILYSYSKTTCQVKIHHHIRACFNR